MKARLTWCIATFVILVAGCDAPLPAGPETADTHIADPADGEPTSVTPPEPIPAGDPGGSPPDPTPGGDPGSSPGADVPVIPWPDPVESALGTFQRRHILFEGDSDGLAGAEDLVSDGSWVFTVSYREDKVGRFRVEDKGISDLGPLTDWNGIPIQGPRAVVGNGQVIALGTTAGIYSWALVNDEWVPCGHVPTPSPVRALCVGAGNWFAAGEGYLIGFSPETGAFYFLTTMVPAGKVSLACEGTTVFLGSFEEDYIEAIALDGTVSRKYSDGQYGLELNGVSDVEFLEGYLYVVSYWSGCVTSFHCGMSGILTPRQVIRDDLARPRDVSGWGTGCVVVADSGRDGLVTFAVSELGYLTSRDWVDDPEFTDGARALSQAGGTLALVSSNSSSLALFQRLRDP